MYKIAPVYLCIYLLATVAMGSMLKDPIIFETLSCNKKMRDHTGENTTLYARLKSLKRRCDSLKLGKCGCTVLTH